MPVISVIHVTFLVPCHSHIWLSFLYDLSVLLDCPAVECFVLREVDRVAL